jgi:soluble lytic murein transglycosylase-like protein
VLDLVYKPMPSPRRILQIRANSVVRAVFLFSLFLGIHLTAQPSIAQIAATTDPSGRRFFVNAEPATVQLMSAKPRKSIYLPGATSFLGENRPELNIDRDGVEKLVREAAERHQVDPALVRAVIETESNWNPAAVSRKGALGLMQLIPTTAQRFGANNAFSPKQNVDAGVRYLKTLLERYNGNLDLALAAYNAGEGAVDRAHGVPAYRETRNYVQRVQEAYYRPGSGRLDSAYTRANQIHRVVEPSGRVIFTNEF